MIHDGLTVFLFFFFAWLLNLKYLYLLLPRHKDTLESSKVNRWVGIQHCYSLSSCNYLIVELIIDCHGAIVGNMIAVMGSLGSFFFFFFLLKDASL